MGEIGKRSVFLLVLVNTTTCTFCIVLGTTAVAPHANGASGIRLVVVNTLPSSEGSVGVVVVDPNMKLRALLRLFDEDADERNSERHRSNSIASTCRASYFLPCEYRPRPESLVHSGCFFGRLPPCSIPLRTRCKNQLSPTNRVVIALLGVRQVLSLRSWPLLALDIFATMGSPSYCGL